MRRVATTKHCVPLGRTASSTKRRMALAATRTATEEEEGEEAGKSVPTASPMPAKRRVTLAATTPPPMATTSSSSSSTMVTPVRPRFVLDPSLSHTLPLLDQVAQHVERAIALEAHHLPVVKTPDSHRQRVTTPHSFRSDALSTARWLLGSRLVRVLPCGTRLSGKIVEVEAYLGPHDKGAHSFGGKRTKRTETMFRAGGVGYLYHIHSCSCFNVIASDAEDPVGVLIRALEPEEGIGHMLQHRLWGRAAKGKTREQVPMSAVPQVVDMTEAERRKLLAALCVGPGCLCHALALDHSMNGVDLVEGSVLFLEHGEHVPASDIVASPRIGIAYAGPWAHAPLRFSVHENPHVSKPWSWRKKGQEGGTTKRQKAT